MHECARHSITAYRDRLPPSAVTSTTNALDRCHASSLSAESVGLAIRTRSAASEGESTDFNDSPTFPVRLDHLRVPCTGPARPRTYPAASRGQGTLPARQHGPKRAQGIGAVGPELLDHVCDRQRRRPLGERSRAFGPVDYRARNAAPPRPPQAAARTCDPLDKLAAFYRGNYERSSSGSSLRRYALAAHSPPRRASDGGGTPQRPVRRPRPCSHLTSHVGTPARRHAGERGRWRSRSVVLVSRTSMSILRSTTTHLAWLCFRCTAEQLQTRSAELRFTV